MFVGYFNKGGSIIADVNCFIPEGNFSEQYFIDENGCCV